MNQTKLFTPEHWLAEIREEVRKGGLRASKTKKQGFVPISIKSRLNER